ncbi:MAG: 50S ribosomal protein L22 [Phycisphaerae bacterium]|nr:50S ribosomal protein L22 [Phycisphaerae bacterium]
MAWQAAHNYARISPRKARVIADLIRGRDVQDALDILKFTHNRAAGMFAKVVTSAVANANEAEAEVDLLYVQEVRADEGPTIKRFRAKDRGRAHPINKRTSHLLVTVEQG